MNELQPDEYGYQNTFLGFFRGDKHRLVLDNPFVKFNKDFEDYPDFHDEHDNIPFPMEVDNLEREKPFKIKKGISHGVWWHDIKTEDDQQFDTADFFGYAHDDEPEDSLMGPTIDSKLDEDEICAFPRNSLAQPVMINEWLNPSEE